MLWGQSIKVYTDHKNLTQDALGLTSERVYHWQLLLKEFAPKIVYIKRMHDTVADSIYQLDYNPKVNPTSKFNYTTFDVSAKGETIVKWKTFSKLCCCYNENNPDNEMQECNLNQVFKNHGKEEELFPLTTQEKADDKLKHYFKCNAVLNKGLSVSQVDNTHVVRAKRVR